MNPVLKPILEQIEQLRTKAEAKTTQIMEDYVVPAIESEKTEQILKELETRFSRFDRLSVITRIQEARLNFIESKVQAARPATGVEESDENSATEENDFKAASVRGTKNRKVRTKSTSSTDTH